MSPRRAAHVTCSTTCTAFFLHNFNRDLSLTSLWVIVIAAMFTAQKCQREKPKDVKLLDV